MVEMRTGNHKANERISGIVRLADCAFLLYRVLRRIGNRSQNERRQGMKRQRRKATLRGEPEDLRTLMSGMSKVRGPLIAYAPAEGDGKCEGTCEKYVLRWDLPQGGNPDDIWFYDRVIITKRRNGREVREMEYLSRGTALTITWYNADGSTVSGTFVYRGDDLYAAMPRPNGQVDWIKIEGLDLEIPEPSGRMKRLVRDFMKENAVRERFRGCLLRRCSCENLVENILRRSLTTTPLTLSERRGGKKYEFRFQIETVQSVFEGSCKERLEVHTGTFAPG